VKGGQSPTNPTVVKPYVLPANVPTAVNTNNNSKAMDSTSSSTSGSSSNYTFYLVVGGVFAAIVVLYMINK
jgi:ABC-type multidrug transport system permease subunit